MTREQTFSDSRLRTTTGHSDVISRTKGLEELSVWCEAMGGAKKLIDGRQQGRNIELIESTWKFLLYESFSVSALAECLTTGS